jgi:hypothetical protein
MKTPMQLTLEYYSAVFTQSEYEFERLWHENATLTHIRMDQGLEGERTVVNGARAIVELYRSKFFNVTTACVVQQLDTEYVGCTAKVFLRVAEDQEVRHRKQRWQFEDSSFITFDTCGHKIMSMVSKVSKIQISNK